MAILFDFNGTMFYDQKFQEIAWRQYLGEKIHRPVTDEEFQTYIHGRNMEETVAYFFHASYSRIELEEMEEDKEVIYRSLCLASPDFRLAPGLVEFLDELKEREVPINIATASGWNNVCFFFEHLHLDRWFDISKVVYNDGTLRGKPEPDFYLRGAEKINIPIEECYVFEDSASGLESGRRAHAKGVVWVDSMGKSADKKEEVCLIIKDYMNLRAEEF